MNFIRNGHYPRTFHMAMHLLSDASHASARTSLGHIFRNVYERNTNKNSKQRNGHRHSSCRRRLGSCIFQDNFGDLCVFSIHTMTRMCNKLTFLLFHLTCRDIYRFGCVRRSSNNFFIPFDADVVFTNHFNSLPQLRRVVRLPKTNIMLHQIDSAINLKYIVSAAVCTMQSFSPSAPHVNGCTISVVSVN